MLLSTRRTLVDGRHIADRAKIKGFIAVEMRCLTKGNAHSFKRSNCTARGFPISIGVFFFFFLWDWASPYLEGSSWAA